ncbi:MAG: helix-turn-helix domain-containing protein [Pseudolabrys sp.]
MVKATLAVVGHIGPAPRGDRMSAPHALAAFAALGQPTRLAIFQLLMSAEPHGLAAGTIAEKVGCPHNTLVASQYSCAFRAGEGRTRRTLDYLSSEC